MKPRSGHLLLAIALVALGVGIAAFAIGGFGESGTPGADTHRCLLEPAGGKAEIRLGSDSVSCPESRRVYAAYAAGMRSGKINGVRAATVVDSWRCQPYGLTAYPSFLRCDHRLRHFDVVSLTPIFHTTQELPRSGSSKAIAFQTQTETIACKMTTHYVLCEIFGRAWTSPAEPAHCTFSRVRSIELRGSGAAFVCTSNAVVLPDGESGLPILMRHNGVISTGPFSCSMRKMGLVCGSPHKHGFLLSFQQIKFF
jgi:hypothetical protein